MRPKRQHRGSPETPDRPYSISDNEPALMINGKATFINSRSDPAAAALVRFPVSLSIDPMILFLQPWGIPVVQRKECHSPTTTRDQRPQHLRVIKLDVPGSHPIMVSCESIRLVPCQGENLWDADLHNPLRGRSLQVHQFKNLILTRH